MEGNSFEYQFQRRNPLKTGLVTASLLRGLLESPPSREWVAIP